MYKDLDRQREANRLANRRYRERKGITGVSRKTPIPSGEADRVSRDPVIPEMPSAWGGPEIYEAWSPNPLPVNYVVDDKPVPAWRAQKDAQMARFLAGVKK